MRLSTSSPFQRGAYAFVYHFLQHPGTDSLLINCSTTERSHSSGNVIEEKFGNYTRIRSSIGAKIPSQMAH